MKSKLFFLSFALWALTFFFRLFIHVEPISNDSIRGKSNAVVEKIIKSADNNDKTATFELILTNNLKGCLINCRPHTRDSYRKRTQTERPCKYVG